MWYKYLIFALLIILMLLLILLFVPIDFYVEYDKKWLFKIKILGLKFSGDSFKSRSKKNKNTNNKSNFKSIFKNLKSRGFINSIKYISSVVFLMGKTAKIFLSKIKIGYLGLNVIISEEDAFETSIKYGQASAVVYPTINYLRGILHIRKLNLLVEPDFKSVKSKVIFKTCFKSNIFNLLVVAIGFVKNYTSLESKYRKEE